MASVTCIDMSRITSNEAGLFATNNQFQKSGPKGFIEVKVLENNDIYVRVDSPGVPDDAIRYRVDGVRQKVVFFSGETLNDGGVREYSGTTGLGCDCCEITGVDAKMKDGVLRMVVSRVKVKDHENKCSLTLPPPSKGRSGQNVEDHPFVVRGRKGAIGEAKKVCEHDESGRLYVGRVGGTREITPSLLRHSVSGGIKFGVLKVLLKPPRRNNNNQ
ncbi:unnamed protein product [Microthlaspi erraticum]|uniref:SHSP domain-containing protein n=1 Tax=Microthlaspi erraticum TaxID=1685480 RepID=A0A6D2JWU9_9BRAS|nr:unnamed protein product [Microthlaspi erraticum]